MGPRDPSDPNRRPSIFPRPEEDEDLRPPDPPRRAEAPDWHDTATGAHAAVPPPGNVGGEPEAEGPFVASSSGTGSRRRRRRRAQLTAIGTTVVVSLAVAGFVAASVLRTPQVEPAIAGVSDSPQPTVTMTPEITHSPEPSPSSTPAATLEPTQSQAPTAAPIPAGPPHDLAPGGWAAVSVGELNVRNEPGLSATSVFRLVRGAVVHLLDESPVDRDGLAWYRVVSLGGARGWAASGSVDTPFMTILVEDAYLLHCGAVDGRIFDVVDGRLEARDPIRIGGLALPTARFTDAELGVFELVRAVRDKVCFGVQAAEDGSATIYVDTGTPACGRPEMANGVYRLVPAPDVDAVTEAQVKEAALVHPAVLSSWRGDDRSSANLRAVFALAAANPGVTGCLEARITNGPRTGMDHTHGFGAVQCIVVERWDGDRLLVRPASGGSSVTLLSPYLDEDTQFGEPTARYVYAFDEPSGASAGVYWSPRPGCG
jgi:hypothetical protein